MVSECALSAVIIKNLTFLAFKFLPRIFEWPKTTNKYIITYKGALIYIMAKILMQTFDYTKVVSGKKHTLYVWGEGGVVGGGDVSKC